MWVQCLGQEDSMEKGVATHSSILAWRIPWTEEPGALQSMWSQSHILPKQLCCTCGIGLKFLLLQIVAKIWYAKLFKLFCFWWDKIISCSNFNWISLFQMKLSLHEYVYFPFLLLFCWLVIFNFCQFSFELLMFWYWFVKVVYTFWSLIIVACVSANVFSVNSLFSSFMVSYDSMDTCLSKLQESVMDREAMLRFMGSQRGGHDWATELNWTEDFLCFNIKM